MPYTELYFFKDPDDSVPFRDWLDRLERKAATKCIQRLELLTELGHKLRRPIADFLRDGIYELRFRYQNVNYRVLYFFSGRNVVVVSHGITKEQRVPPKEINKALARRRMVEADFDQHTFKPEE